MLLKVLNENFSIIQVPTIKDINFDLSPLFIGKTEEELSVVLATKEITNQMQILQREDDWKALKVEGVLDFSLVGILAQIATILAEESISIFALSTFNTDYILVKNEKLDSAIKVLKTNGFQVEL